MPTIEYKKNQRLVWKSKRYPLYEGLELTAVENGHDGFIECRVNFIPKTAQETCKNSYIKLAHTYEFGSEYLKPLITRKLKFKDLLGVQL